MGNIEFQAELTKELLTYLTWCDDLLKGITSVIDEKEN